MRLKLDTIDRLTYRELIYAIVSFLFVLCMTIERSAWYTLEGTDITTLTLKMIRYAVYFLCIVGNVDRHHRVKDILIACVLTGVCILLHSRTYLITLILMISLVRNIDREKFLRIGVFFRSLALFIVVILSQAGILLDYIFEKDKRARHGLGYDWATAGPIIFMFIILQLACIKRKKFSLLEFFIFEGIAYWLFVMTDTRLAFVLTTLALIMFTFIDFNKYKFTKRKLYLAVPAVISIFAYYIHKMYNPANRVWDKLNQLLTYRLSLGKDALREYGITLFGQPVKWVGNTELDPSSDPYNYVDSGYLQVLIEAGLIQLILIIILYTFSLYVAKKANDKYMFYSILVVLVLCITEPRLIDFFYNPICLIGFCKMDLSNIIKVRKKAIKSNATFTN